MTFLREYCPDFISYTTPPQPTFPQASVRPRDSYAATIRSIATYLFRVRSRNSNQLDDSELKWARASSMHALAVGVDPLVTTSH